MTTATIENLENEEVEVIKSVPWAKQPLTIKKQSFPTGEVPEHLKPYLFKKNDIVKQCVNTVPKDIIGTEKIQKINECVAEKLSKK